MYLVHTHWEIWEDDDNDDDDGDGRRRRCGCRRPVLDHIELRLNEIKEDGHTSFLPRTGGYPTISKTERRNNNGVHNNDSSSCESQLTAGTHPVLCAYSIFRQKIRFFLFVC